MTIVTALYTKHHTLCGASLNIPNFPVTIAEKSWRVPMRRHVLRAETTLGKLWQKNRCPQEQGARLQRKISGSCADEELEQE